MNINVNNSIFEKYYNSSSYSAAIRQYPKYEDLQACLCIESALSDITCQLVDKSTFVKNFSMKSVRRAGYYLFPIINNLINLTVLKLKDCYIPYLTFLNLGESLSNLKRIELDNVKLVKLPSHNTLPKDFIFPMSLVYLKLTYCEVINSELLSDPYKFLFSEINTRHSSRRFVLPKFSVSSLKELEYYGNDYKDIGLLEFLEVNPNLESLFIEHLDLNGIKSFNLVKNLSIDYVENEDCIDRFPTQQSIEKLKIFVESDIYYENIKKLSLSCPNLKFIHFILVNIYNIQQSLDNFLITILSNLPKLKTLQLEFIRKTDEIIDISKFLNIEELILEINFNSVLNLNFKNNLNLKLIEFRTFLNESNLEKIRLKFNNYKNWIFKYNLKTIKGYKLY